MGRLADLTAQLRLRPAAERDRPAAYVGSFAAICGGRHGDARKWGESRNAV